MTWALTAAGVLLGILLGWLLRGDQTEGDRDWKTRLAARDEDLRVTQEELADTVVRLQELEAGGRRPGESDELTEVRRAMVELGRQAEDAQRALHGNGDELAAALAHTTDLRRRLAVLEKEAGTSSNARLESLEFELATLESLRCPDPGAHSRSPKTPETL